MKVSLHEHKTYTYESHTDFIFDVSIGHIRLTVDQFLEYIKTYHPSLEMEKTAIFNPINSVGNWLSRVVCGRYYFTHFSSADVLRVIKFVEQNYDVDFSKPDNYGSPLILYAIQSGFRNVVEYLLSHGAILIENGVGIRNKVRTLYTVDIASCVMSCDEDYCKYIHKKVFNQVV